MMAHDDDTMPSLSLNVPEAGAKQTEPLSKAVAVSYDTAQDGVPVVTASGKGAVAEQIVNLAFQHGIKVREDAELVDILSLIDIDSPIPLEAFAAVAEILSYVYEANASFKQRSTEVGR
jgi:flagellar biosynthesis protein